MYKTVRKCITKGRKCIKKEGNVKKGEKCTKHLPRVVSSTVHNWYGIVLQRMQNHLSHIIFTKTILKGHIEVVIRLQ